MAKVEFKPPSLARQFQAPDGYRGEFGWLCGYSADARFLNDAAERFLQQSFHQRAHVGRIALALLLDPGNIQISPVGVPGVIHLPMKGGARPFKLLHAKVALLGFRHVTEPRRWCLRLIVSTGNWTRETLEETLDLAWAIDVLSTDLSKPSEQVRDACIDFRAAWDMLQWLRGRFDQRLLDVVPAGRRDTESSRSSRLLEEWLGEIIASAPKGRSRFMDNRNESLLEKVLSAVKASGKVVSRNYLAFGSGFYESGGTDGKIPSVLAKIVSRLRSNGLISSRPEVDVFVNALACQAVAFSWKSIIQSGWAIRIAGRPTYFHNSLRSLHAKFIFSASYRSNSNSCGNGWLYLGSGNLTTPGFMSPMSTSVGNLEAGVLILPEGLCWWARKGVPAEQVITNILPLQWENEIDSPAALQHGEDMPERDTPFCSPPISCLCWQSELGVGRLTVLELVSQQFEILTDSGKRCRTERDGSFIWPGDRPRQVEIIWQSETGEHRAFIPVIDEFGRIAATALSRIDMDEAWWRLADFPIPPDEEALAPPEENDALGRGHDHATAGVSADATYPVRRMMQLIENIATKQIAINPADWRMWCARLEQCLCQVADNPAVMTFQDMGINPLSPLWHASFRPDFAESDDQREGSEYEDVLRRIENSWNVTGLVHMGRAK